MRRLFVIALVLEIGFALIVVPWSAFWDRNYFAQAVPALGVVMSNSFVKGAVSGVGVVNVVAGLADLVSLLLARGQDPGVTPLPPLRDD